MTHVLRSLAVRGLSAVAVMLTMATPAAAETIYAVDIQNLLLFFDSATPGTVNAIGPITGLSAGDTVRGIDFRPANGALYAIGAGLGSSRLYTLNTATAAATLVGPLAADPVDSTNPFLGLLGTQIGMDFNPVNDRLRLTDENRQNLRVNPANGLVITDDPLAYSNVADPNFGDLPVDTAVAYTNNFAGALSTTLRGVDFGQNPDVLVTHSPPNNGFLQTLAILPFNGIAGSYDISGPTGTEYFAIHDGVGGSSFYASGPSGIALVGPIGGRVPVTVVGIAAPVGTAVPEPATIALLASGVAGWVTTRRRSIRQGR